MLYFWVSDYTLNSAADVVQKTGMLSKKLDAQSDVRRFSRISSCHFKYFLLNDSEYKIVSKTVVRLLEHNVGCSLERGSEVMGEAPESYL